MRLSALHSQKSRPVSKAGVEKRSGIGRITCSFVTLELPADSGYPEQAVANGQVPLLSILVLSGTLTQSASSEENGRRSSLCVCHLSSVF